ncbi:MAG: DUF2125 domain-containing protein [Pseudomonadota bacterium]
MRSVLSRTLERPIRLVGPLAIAIALAYSTYWFVAARILEDALTSQLRPAPETGVSVAYSSLSISGFPFLWRARIESPQAQAGGVGRWSADRVEIDALPYSLSRVVLTLKGPQRLDFDPALGLQLESAVLTGDTLRASLARGGPKGAPWRGALDLRNAELRIDGTGTAALERFVADAFPESAGARVGGRLTAPAWSDASGELRIDYADFDVSYAMDATGGVDALIRYIRLANGGGALSADGTVRISPEGAASGEATVDVRKPKPLIDAAVAYGALTQEDADAASLAVAAKGMSQGGAAKLRIDFDDAGVRVDGVEVARL